MKKYNTGIAVHIGENSYPIYLIVRDTNNADFKYDLWCEYEIYAMAWFDIYTEAIENYENGKLEEIDVKN